MMDNKIYQVIFDEISKFLPNAWENLVVYLEHGEDSYSYSFYVKVNNKYKKCFDLEYVSEDEMFKSFARIEKSVDKERKKLGSDKWSNMTMVVNSNGKMNTSFDYTDLSKGTYKYKKEWQKKYLV